MRRESERQTMGGGRGRHNVPPSPPHPLPYHHLISCNIRTSHSIKRSADFLPGLSERVHCFVTFLISPLPSSPVKALKEAPCLLRLCGGGAEVAETIPP